MADIVHVKYPDMTTHDMFINWLFDYFHELYEKKTGETISFAYAFNAVVACLNQNILNKGELGDELINKPNVNPDAIKVAIAHNA
jgi:hypothetical protein